jgi:hypothetical protein
MGLFKNVVTAFTSGNLKRGLDAARNPPSQAEIEASLAMLTPEQRAAYDASMAQVAAAQAQTEANWEATRVADEARRVLGGPAGHRLYGGEVRDAASPGDLQAQIMEQGAWGVMQQMRSGGQEELKDRIRGALNVEDPEIDDPAERARVSAAERAARDEARAPYVALDPLPIAITRIPTRGGTQVQEVLGFLRANGLAARPDHVFGVYRVPDRISGQLTPYSEKGRLVEWDVVYRPLPDDLPRSDAACAITSFVADDRWVARRLGEPSVLDEDLALEFCLRAGIGPEQCLGIARVPEFRTLRFGGDHEDYMRTIVKGVVAIHPEEQSGAYHRMRDEAPLPLADPAANGVRVEVLSWAEIAQVVHPKMHHPPLVPSPFPYLPSTPEELLRAYLEVVGVKPSDSYGVQATVDRMRELVQGGFINTTLGPKQQCVDGRERMRSHACEEIVIAYRDAPEYVEGRARWEAYQRDVLQARLERGAGGRAPLVDDGDLSYIPAGLRGVVRVAAAIDSLELLGQEKPPPFRYCWPPVD